MKRLAIFALLGPLIGMATVLLTVPGLTGKIVMLDATEISVIVVVMYFFGLVPALIVCLVDWYLARRNIDYRPVWCALLGVVVSSPLIVVNPSQINSVRWMLFGLFGAVPAAVCSWLSSSDKAV